MAEAALVQAKTSSYANPPSLTLDSTPTEGNLLIAKASGRSGQTSLTMSSSGWSKIFDHPANENDSTYRRILTVWRKVAGASESTSVALTSTGGSCLLTVTEYSPDTDYDTWTFEDHSVDDDGATTNGDNVSSGSTASISNTPQLLIGVGMAKHGGGAAGDVSNDDMTNLLNEDDAHGGGTTGLTNAWAYDQDNTTGTKESQVDWGTSTREGTIMAILVFSMSSSAGATEVALAGSLPAFSGGLASQQYEDLTGELPAPTATIAPDYEKRHVAGALPPQAGVLTSQLDAARAVGGTLPAQSGVLSLLAHIGLAGDLPAQAGALAVLQTKAFLYGDLPAMNGAIEALYGKRNIAGSLPAQSGVIGAGLNPALAGSLPPQSSALSLLAHIGLAGTLPPQAGALVALYKAVHLYGDLPAQQGALATDVGVALAGSLPPMGGGLRYSKTIEITAEDNGSLWSVISDGASYSDARSGFGVGTDSPLRATWAYSDPSYRIGEAFVEFDTSVIPAGATIDSVGLEASAGGAPSQTDGWQYVNARLFDWGAGVDTTDFRETDGESAGDTLLAKLDYDDVGSTDTFVAESAFKSAINKSGMTRVYFVIEDAEAATAPTGPNSWTGSRNTLPVLTVTYSLDVPVFLYGNLPGSEGALGVGLEKNVAGTLPAMQGVITSGTIGVEGVLPAATGSLVFDIILRHIALTGALPPQSGTLSASQALARALAGSIPAQSGALGVGQTLARPLAGSLPPMDGEVVETKLPLAGNLPPMTGDVSSVGNLTGELPAQAGELDVPYISLALAGSLPAQVGTLETGFPFRQESLAGTLPSMEGGVTSVLDIARDLAGALPAQSGSVTVNIILQHVALAGILPSMEGSLTVFQSSLAIYGILPAMSGDLGAPEIGLAFPVPGRGSALLVVRGSGTETPPRGGGGDAGTLQRGRGNI